MRLRSEACTPGLGVEQASEGQAAKPVVLHSSEPRAGKTHAGMHALPLCWGPRKIHHRHERESVIPWG